MDRIGLQAVLEDADFQAGVKNYNAGIDSMEKANKSAVASSESLATGLSSTDEAMEQSGKSAVELASQMEIVEKVYGQIKDTIGQAVELAELGSQANRTEERFRAFANQIGDADELLAAFQRGAGGTVDKMTAMSSAAKLLQMGLVSNNDEMEMVVEIATRLGDQTASAGDRVADFALLLANQSIPRLDNFGISSGKVRDRIAELQKAFPGMSREAAFSQAVFEEGAKSLDVLGERTADAGAKMEMARAKIRDMQVEMGQRLLPVVAQVFGYIENLNAGTLALIATLGTGVGVLVKFSGGLGGAAENLGSFAGKLGTSTAALGALAVATVVLVEAVGNLQETMDGMGEAQDNAQAAAATLGDQVQALVADGMSLGDAMAQVGDKVNNATANFNDARVLGIIPLKNAFNAGAEFSKTMEDATYSLQGALVANTGTYSEYVGQVVAYNEGITDSTGRLVIYTEKQFAMAQAHQQGIGFLSETTSRLQDYVTTLTDVTTTVESDYTPAWLTAQRVEEGFSEMQVAATNRMQDRERALGSLNQSTEKSSEIMAQAAQAAENRASIDEKAARVQEMQAATTAAATAAMEAKRQADNATAVAEADLATKVMDASDAMIAQTFIQGLDPEAMGLIAYREAVENIQLAFGLATPESIALSRGMTQGIDAANAGQISYKDLDAFILALRKDAADGSVDFDNLAHQFASTSQESAWLADNIAATGDAIVDNVSKTEELIAAEDGLESGVKELKDQMMNTSGVIANVADDTELWKDSITGTDHTLLSSQLTMDEWTDRMQGLDARLVTTGEDMLDVEQKVRALNAGLERTDDAGTEASTGLDIVQASAGETALALEEAAGATDELDSALAETAAGAGAHGAAIASNLGGALDAGMRPLIDSFKGKLQELRDALPGSEPKDPTSPLYGLDKSGEAIIHNINAGIDAAGPSAVDAMNSVGEAMGEALANAVVAGIDDEFARGGFGTAGRFEELTGMAGVFGGLGGAAGTIFQREVIAPLQERRNELESAIKEITKTAETQTKELDKITPAFGEGFLDYFQEQIDKVGAGRVIETLRADLEGGLLSIVVGDEVTTRSQILAQQEQLEQWIMASGELNQLIEHRNNLQEESATTLQELVAEQERLNRLQKQQENLKFLEQQMALLDLIAEKGLDAEQVLGGLQLGLEADVGAVLDAMAAAMQQVIAQAEDELGVASPSKVFEDIGAQTMMGMAMGIEKLMSLPVAQSAIATQAMIAVPASIAARGNTTIDNSRTVGEINVSAPSGGTPAGNAQLAALVRQVVREEVRGA